MPHRLRYLNNQFSSGGAVLGRLWDLRGGRAVWEEVGLYGASSPINAVLSVSAS